MEGCSKSPVDDVLAFMRELSGGRKLMASASGYYFCDGRADEAEQNAGHVSREEFSRLVGKLNAYGSKA